MIQRQLEAVAPSMRGFSRIGAIVLVSAGLAACSSVPNWANPARIYDSVAGVFSGDDDDGAFPTVSDVPDRPQTASAESRREAAQGLVADRENARYTDEVIRREDESATQVAAAPAVPQAAPAPTPAPRPAPPPRETAAPAPTPAAPPPARVAQAPAPRPSLLEERRVTPSAPPTATATEDSLDARRTITSGRTTPPPVSPRRVESVAPAMPAPPQAVPRASVVTESAPVAPAPVAPRPAPVAQVAAAPAPVVVPQQPAVAVAPGQSVVSQTFARMLQDSASTVSTAPANATFQAPSALPIQPGERPVSPIIADTYNAALAATQQTLAQTGGSFQAASFQGGAPAGGASTSVQFGHDSATLTSAARAEIRKVADQYKASGGVIRVVGHASSRTKNMSVAEHHLVNFRISLDRAQAVAGELARLGVPTEAIFVEARGASDPAFFESMPAGEAGNRRTEIFLDFSTS